ncbi:DUF423 domain-containing protein [Utexia brackfieldae]|uniref:DUF423 domain-containing protein n=1 Tax=Utexia brackfieldae TaxID=3074108 RepID=UPI00370DCF31
MKSQLCLIAAGFFGMTGIILGALASHALKAHLTLPQLEIFKLGVEYQMYHALALLALAIWLRFQPNRLLGLAAGLFIIGIVFFSGTLYGITCFALPNIGTAPIGGFAFIFGWLVLMVAGFKLKNTNKKIES